MLDVTVKTLDSQSRTFSVDDNITVGDFKAHIAGSVNISVERQRLIFQGRVLQDSAQLNARGDISGKVIHLVERLPTPAQPTPAEQARSQPRPQQPTTQANNQQRPNAPQPGNLLGPFPMPGPDSNYGQLVQQMIQQALTGMGNTAGPTMIRSTVRHPNAPGGGASTEIQIQIAPQGGTSQSGSSSQPRPPTQTSQQQQSTTNQQPTPVRTASAQPPLVVQSEPRRQLQNVEQLLSKLEQNVVILETKNYEQAQQTQDDQASSSEGAPDAEGASTSAEPMDIHDGEGLDAESLSGGTVSTEPPSSAGSNTSASRHPTFPEVGVVMRRVHDLESRFLPFLLQYTEFLENDPAFSSTESPEYKAMMGFLTMVFRTQRTLAHIHRILSLFAIPLSETPPRRMLMQGPCPTHRGLPPHSRRINRVVSAGPYLNQPRVRAPHHHHHPPGPHGPYQGVPVLIGPVGPGSNVRPGIVPVSAGILGFAPAGQPRPVRPHQSGLYGHLQAASTTTTSSSQQTSGAQQPQTAPRTSASVSDSSTTTRTTTGTPPPYLLMSEASTLEPSPDAPTDGDSEPMTIHVSTHIHPRINITIYADCLPPEGRPDRIPLFGVIGSVQADEQGNILPVELQMSDIPGVPEVGIREMENHIRENVLRALNAMNLIPRQLQHQREEMQRTQNTSRSSSQAGNVNIARLVGQNVHSAVMNHRRGHSATSTTSSSTTPNTTTSSSSARQTTAQQLPPHQVTVISNAPVQTQAPTSATGTRPTTSTTPTTSASPTIDANTRNMLTDLINQITGGNFGNTGAAAAASRSSNIKVRGYSGREHKRIPTIARTPNCVNDIVRGHGYPEEMMELTGHGNILALVLFLAGELLTIPDCLSFMAGSPEPGDRLREPLRIALTECWFGGETPNRDQIEEEVDLHSEEARDVMKTYFEDQQPKSPDIDIIESNLSLYRYVLRRILHLLYLGESGEFARGIFRHLLDSFNLVIHLNINILRGTEDAVTNLVLKNLGTALDPYSHGPGGSNQPLDPMMSSLRNLLSINLIPFARNHPVPQDRVDQFIMNVQTPEASEEESPTVPETPAPETETAPQPSSAPEPPSEEKQEENLPESDTSAQPASYPEPATEEKQEEEESRGPVVEEQAFDMDVDSTDQTMGAAGGNPDWRTMVPTEWISIIESDIEKQKNLPEQPPYSDAYLAGTPASKRRKV